VDEPEEEVLGAYVVVVEKARLLLGEHDHPAGPIREALKHSVHPLRFSPFSLAGHELLSRVRDAALSSHPITRGDAGSVEEMMDVDVALCRTRITPV
jgi:hypothetical protein